MLACALAMARTAPAQRTLVVPSAGLPTLAAGLQSALPGDEIRYSGDSSGRPVVIDKPVTIVGVGRPDVLVVAMVAPVTFRNVRVVPLGLSFNGGWHCTVATTGTLRFEDCIVEPTIFSTLDESVPTSALLAGNAGRAEFVRTRVLGLSTWSLPHAFCGARSFEPTGLGGVALNAPLYFEDSFVEATNAGGFFFDPNAVPPFCTQYGVQPGVPAVLAPRTTAVRSRFEDGNSSNQPDPTAQPAGPLTASQFGALEAYEMEWQAGVVGGATGPRGAVQVIGGGTAPLQNPAPARVGGAVALTMSMQPGQVGFLLLGLPLSPSRSTPFGPLHTDFVAALPMTDRVPLSIPIPRLPALAGLTVHGQALITQPAYALQNPVSLQIFR